jgi:hypothetical protein
MNFFRAFFSTSPAMSNASKQKVQQLIDNEPVGASFPIPLFVMSQRPHD